ncbi:hypothetical protein PRIPAC_83072 [Pristionchus pacificus]|nr:hypothetical protein PRIPAC_83072 [Pristionchus pacificus]
MVCATALLSSSLALSLLHHSTPPSQSFVISPYSLDTALSVIHDGAGGPTQQELTDLLLKGCTPAEVTAHYSSLALSLLANNVSGVTFKSANRFYVSESTSLKKEYEAEVVANYQVKVEKVNFREKAAVASQINSFVNDATEGMIKQVVDSQSMDPDTMAMFVNAIYFLGKWKFTLSKPYTYTFKGIAGNRTMDFMKREEVLRVNLDSEFGDALILPYKDESYKFFFLMPKETSNINTLRDSLTGKELLDILRNAVETEIDVRVPKFKV